MQQGLVRLQIVGHLIQIEIVDNGEGADEYTLSRMNEKEFRTTKTTGYGIGLNEVWKTIQRHNGALSFEKAPNGGMTVRVRLPKAEIT